MIGVDDILALLFTFHQDLPKGNWGQQFFLYNFFFVFLFLDPKAHLDFLSTMRTLAIQLVIAFLPAGKDLLNGQVLLAVSTLIS